MKIQVFWETSWTICNLMFEELSFFETSVTASWHGVMSQTTLIGIIQNFSASFKRICKVLHVQVASLCGMLPCMCITYCGEWRFESFCSDVAVSERSLVLRFHGTSNLFSCECILCLKLSCFDGFFLYDIICVAYTLCLSI